MEKNISNFDGLHFDEVKIKNGDIELLNISAKIKPGEVLTLMGASGSGKSSLINAICGFLPKGFSCTGTISLDGRDISDLPVEKRRLGVLFQDPLLFPHLNVEENILFAMQQGGSTLEREKKVLELLKAVDMNNYQKRDVATLSGGQQARISLIRVLATDPKALLLDEPFSKLDVNLRQNVAQLVFEIVKERKLPTLLVTHDALDAKAARGAIISL